MRRTTCSACASPDLEIFLDLGLSPIADAYLEHPDVSVNRYPLEVAVCGKCHLVQLLEVLDSEVLFESGYSFYSSASPPLSAYHHSYANEVIATYGNLPSLSSPVGRVTRLGGRPVIEIGCNDGDLLRHFKSAGFQTLGIDPAGGPVAVARSRGLEVINVPFGSQKALDLLRQNDMVRAGIVIANHVLAHVAEVADFMAGIALLLDKDSIAMIEVQYLPDLLVNNAFDLVYHEHRNFFSLTSLELAAGRFDLHIIDAQLTRRQGGSLRVTLSRVPALNADVEALRQHERWLQDWGPYAGFQGRVDRIRARLLDLIADEIRQGRKIVGYGAPAKATTLLNYCGIDASMLEYVVDSTIAKQGRFIPGTGLQILPPDAESEPADTFLALAWNYLTEIMRNNADFTAKKGRWISPIPAPVIL